MLLSQASAAGTQPAALLPDTAAALENGAQFERTSYLALSRLDVWRS
jgi:hypothetical protein